MLVQEEVVGKVEDLKIYYEGSDNPAEDHEIIGLAFYKDGTWTTIGDIDKIEKYQER